MCLWARIIAMCTVGDVRPYKYHTRSHMVAGVQPFGQPTAA